MSANPYHYHSPNLSTMPDLCLLQVFRRLPLSTLYGTVGQVCRNWTRLQAEALAKRRRLVLVSSRSEQDLEVIDRLYNLEYREMECDDMRPLIKALGRQGHGLVVTSGGTTTRFSLKEEHILWSVLCIREPYHFVIAADDDYYLHQIRARLPRITNLAVMFDYIPTRAKLAYDIHQVHDSDDSEDNVFPDFIKSPDDDLIEPARKAVGQLCTVLGHYRHQLVSLMVQLNLNCYLDNTLQRHERIERQQAADRLFRTLDTMTSLRELCLQNYLGPLPSEQFGSAALGSNLRRLVGSFDFIIQCDRQARPLLGDDFGAQLTTLTLVDVECSTVREVVRLLADYNSRRDTAATATAPTLYPRLNSLTIDFDGYGPFDDDDGDGDDDGPGEVRLPSVKLLCLSGFGVSNRRTVTANMGRCFPSLQVLQLHSPGVGLLPDTDLAECWPECQQSGQLRIVRAAADDDREDRVFLQCLAA